MIAGPRRMRVLLAVDAGSALPRCQTSHTFAISEQLNLTLCLSPIDAHIMLVMEGEGRSAKAQKQAAHVHMERLTALPGGKRQKIVTKRSYEYHSLFYCYTKINYHPS